MSDMCRPDSSNRSELALTRAVPSSRTLFANSNAPKKEQPKVARDPLSVRLANWYSDKKAEAQWWHAIFIFSIISLVVCLLQVMLPPPFGMRQPSAEVAQQPFSDGCQGGMAMCVCPRATICADTRLYMALLALARASAFFDYPLYMMMFLSKAHNLNNLLRNTIFRWWVDFGDMHHIHNLFGVVVGIETMSHSFFHILRWALRDGDIRLLTTTATGISGLTAMLATPLIVWPMALPSLKKRLRFEIRKGLHYLSWVWAIALLYHAPNRIYWLIGIPAAVYAADYIAGLFLRLNIVDTVIFERYGERGVVCHFENPKGFDCTKTSYVYIMCPWISKYQWHAFTLFPYPSLPNHSMLCLGTAGDWTKQLYEIIQAPVSKPMNIIGPFLSSFSDRAIKTINAIAVASGIGITPTLSLMQSYVGTKRINIVWVCRDPGLVEYFLHKVDLASITQFAFAMIFYTGKRELVLPKNVPANFFIFRTRPELERIVAGIVSTIESGEDLPEEMYRDQAELADVPFELRIKIALGRVCTMYSRDEMFKYAVEKTEEAKRKTHDIEGGCLTAATGERRSLALGHSRGKNNGTLRRRKGAAGSNQPSNLTTASRDNELSPVDEEGDLISREGLEAMISEFLGGIGEYSSSDLEDLYNQVDADGSGEIDREEFEDFLDMVNSNGTSTADDDVEKKILRGMSRTASCKTLHSIDASSRHSSKNNLMDGVPEEGEEEESPSSFGDDEDVKYLVELSMEKDRPLKDWSIFYCGASGAIEGKLKDITKKYGMGIAVEKFDW